MTKEPRKYLTDHEVTRLLAAARKSERYPERNYAIILMMYRHGLRASELCEMRLDDLNLKEGKVYIKRAKGGLQQYHPLHGDEIRAYKAWLKERESFYSTATNYLFLSERGPFCRFGLNALCRTLGGIAKIEGVHPHRLRHACGHYLADKAHDSRLIQDYLGHRDISSTVRYTQLSPTRFNNLWKK